MKKIIAAIIITVFTSTSAQAYGVQGKPFCANLSQFGNSKYFLTRGMRDKDTFAKRDISELQNFLANKYGLVPSDAITGYFGKTTETYVKKYQKENGLPQSGMVGQASRAKLAAEQVCKVSRVSSDSQARVSVNKVTINELQGDYKNLPKDSRIRFVSLPAGNVYDAQSTLVASGGDGALVVSLPTSLTPGLYYLRATGYYTPNTVIAESNIFEVGSGQLLTSYGSYQTSNGTTVSYPNNWTLTTQGGDAFRIAKIKNTTQDGEGLAKMTAEVVVTEKTDFYATTTLSEIVEKRNKAVHILSTYSSETYALVKSERYPYKNAEGWLLEENIFVSSEQSKEVKVNAKLRTLYIKKGEKVVILEMAALDAAWQKYVNIFDKVMNSLSVDYQKPLL